MKSRDASSPSSPDDPRRPDAALTARGVEKSFGAGNVLAGVSIELASGEVHALLGENGAGKSTLIRILSGALEMDRGDLAMNGVSIRFESPIHARRSGVATIHQELSLIGSMTVAENLALSGGLLLHHSDDIAHAKKVLSEHAIDVSPTTLVEDLPVFIQQQIEIAKAIGEDVRVLVLDEPTSALTDAEAAVLFDRIGREKARGVAILFVSHRLDEVFAIADRITVLADGKVSLSAPKKELTRDSVVRAMLGRSPVDHVIREAAASAPVRFSIQDVRGISLSIERGSIVGLTGLRGSGASELLRELFGVEASQQKGVIRVDGHVLAPGSPEDRLGEGIAYLPADRKREGLFADFPVPAAATLSALHRIQRGPIVSPTLERALVANHAGKLALPPDALEKTLGTLSGGSQQKVNFLRAVLTEPKVLLLDEPTRGVDLGAKADIHAIIRDLARRGASVLFFTSDVDELFALADRIIVLRRGAVSEEIPRERATREAVLRASLGEASL